MAKNNNIVGQGLDPAVLFGILPMAKRANTVRPYDWIFIIDLEFAPQQCLPLEGKGDRVSGG
ncbi:MAG: hypothetical protein IKV98_02740 [Clostridia bacterium]|nr:hypothetical protein [Clostridia bacterium]